MVERFQRAGNYVWEKAGKMSGLLQQAAWWRSSYNSAEPNCC